MNTTTTADSCLPHEHKETLFLTDSGIETTMVFLDGIDLRDFAAFEQLTTSNGRGYLKAYYRRHAALAEQEKGVGFVFESATWRASPDWLQKLGYYDDKHDKETDSTMQDIINQSIAVMRDVQKEFPNVPSTLSGCIGPRADGYVADRMMSVKEAQQYHLPQVTAFQKAGANMVTAITMNYANEAIGIVKDCQQVGIPVVVSFTCETNGLMVTGESLQEAIAKVDEATNQGPAYYMLNCAHPIHFHKVLQEAAAAKQEDSFWLCRIGGIRANASKQSHAELDQAEELDDGDPHELGQNYSAILPFLPNANVFGGCCGTDHRHVIEIRNACAGYFLSSSKK